jgi:hypothetical protein
MTEMESFDHAAGFERGELSGNLRLGRLEALYEELFAEVIEDGVITLEERAQLDKMADQLGLDRMRLRRLEDALQAAYEAKHHVRIRDLADEAPPAASLLVLEAATDPRTLAIQRRVAFLEQRVRELEAELATARANVAVDVDLSDLGASTLQGGRVPDDDPVELQRVLRHDPRDTEALHALYRAWEKRGEVDRSFCAAQVLAHLGAADAGEKAFFEQRRNTTLIRPKLAMGPDAWKLLAHPEQEPLVGEVFAAVAPAVLLGRISALRRDKQLPKLDPEKKVDPVQSTVQAVRCFSWAAAIFGMNAPPIYADADMEGTASLVPAMPPALRLGHALLSGRSTSELAFLAGEHLSYHRAEHVVRLLVPGVPELEEIFLAALSIGNPGLPLAPKVKELVVPIARAIEPILEPHSVDRLRGHFLRFVEEGGRTNLHRWAASIHKTARRAGLLVSGDLGAASSVIEIEAPAAASAEMDDLLSFVVSDRYTRVRKQIGIALEN